MFTKGLPECAEWGWAEVIRDLYVDDWQDQAVQWIQASKASRTLGFFGPLGSGP